MNVLVQAVAVFCSAFVMDWVWIGYMHYAAKKDAELAATYSMVLILLAGFNVISYTSHYWLVGVAMIGAYLGTYSAIKKGPK